MVKEELLRVTKKWDFLRPGARIRPDIKLNPYSANVENIVSS